MDNKQLLERAATDQLKIAIDLHSVGTGTMRTSATYAALFIQLEGSRQDQIDVLDSVLDALGIHPEEILHHRVRPACVDEDKRHEWEMDGEDLRSRLAKAAAQSQESK